MSCGVMKHDPHDPILGYEYRVVHYLPAANRPRWVTAGYFTKLDEALDLLCARRANGDETARLEECAWREVAT